LILNVTAGLLFGLTFFRSENTLLGTQNKLFALQSIFVATVLAVPLAQQLQSMFVAIRTVYEV
ncbi:hypothetical protein PAXINDRAFT_61938, partial [Paxillus involutus ATCC 200175]